MGNREQGWRGRERTCSTPAPTLALAAAAGATAHWPPFVLVSICLLVLICPCLFTPAQLCWLTLVSPCLCLPLFVCWPPFVPTHCYSHSCCCCCPHRGCAYPCPQLCLFVLVPATRLCSVGLYSHLFPLVHSHLVVISCDPPHHQCC